MIKSEFIFMQGIIDDNCENAMTGKWVPVSRGCLLHSAWSTSPNGEFYQFLTSFGNKHILTAHLYIILFTLFYCKTIETLKIGIILMYIIVYVLPKMCYMSR